MFRRVSAIAGALAFVGLLWAAWALDQSRRRELELARVFENDYGPWRIEVVDLLSPRLFVDSVADSRGCQLVVVLVLRHAVDFQSDSVRRFLDDVPPHCAIVLSSHGGGPGRVARIRSVAQFRSVTGIAQVPTFLVVSSNVVTCVGIGQVPESFWSGCLSKPSGSAAAARFYRGAGATSIGGMETTGR